MDQSNQKVSTDQSVDPEPSKPSELTHNLWGLLAKSWKESDRAGRYILFVGFVVGAIVFVVLAIATDLLRAKHALFVGLVVALLVALVLSPVVMIARAMQTGKQPPVIGCPACKKLVRVPTEFLGKSVACPFCNASFKAAATPDGKSSNPP